MYLVAIAWGYVVIMMAVAEATSANGTLLGALVTFVLYGAVPLSIVMYLLGTPARRRARRAAERSARAAQPDGSGHPPGDAVPPVREEP
jgi:membrane protein implicated in regulation of membrane protease activity